MGEDSEKTARVERLVTSYVSVILNQVILMLILVVAGFISFKTHIITGKGISTCPTC